MATIILAHEKGYPLDEIIFSEVMFDENISGELPEHIGWRYGFPMVGRCVINNECKVTPIKDYIKSIGEYRQYIGIAADEPKRLERLTDNKISILAKEGYTEAKLNNKENKK